PCWLGGPSHAGHPSRKSTAGAQVAANHPDGGHPRRRLATVAAMISVRAVSKSFGRVNAVSGVSFEVARGEVVGLLGANGAGKTTTIRMVTGFVPPDQGAISVDGHDTLNDSRAARRSIGYLPESA